MTETSCGFNRNLMRVKNIDDIDDMVVFSLPNAHFVYRSRHRSWRAAITHADLGPTPLRVKGCQQGAKLNVPPIRDGPWLADWLA